MSKLKKIHKYISTRILWDGFKEVTTSSPLRNVMRKEKGNSADINMILIAMLRSAGIKADPVILSTRSNGSLNQSTAILQQFNYLVAAVTVDGKIYLVDATDPLRPFNQLPFDCLNDSGRLISKTESRFVVLKNNEKFNNYYRINLTLDKDGNINGNLEMGSSDYSAYNIRKFIKLESEEGYFDFLRSLFPNTEMSDFKLTGLHTPDSDLVFTSNIKISKGAQIAGDKLILNPFVLSLISKNPYYSTERRFPVDLGCPVLENLSIRISVPEGFTLLELPSDITFTLGTDGGKYEFSCSKTGKDILISSNLNIIKTTFQTSEYPFLRGFYEKMLQKQAEIIILKRNPLN
jgi:hypothetical protein